MSSRVRGMLRLREDGDAIDQERDAADGGTQELQQAPETKEETKEKGTLTQRGKGQHSECLPKTKRALGGVFRLLSSSISRDWLGRSLETTCPSPCPSPSSGVRPSEASKYPAPPLVRFTSVLTRWFYFPPSFCNSVFQLPNKPGYGAFPNALAFLLYVLSEGFLFGSPN